MTCRNPYEDLGVRRTATPAEIRKAYRKLVVKYHPGKDTEDKIARDRFKAICEAHAVLGDPEKRRAYDQDGAAGGETHRAGATEPHTTLSDVGIDDLLGILSGRRHGEPQERRSAAIRGEDLTRELVLSLDEAFHGTVRLLRLHGHTFMVTIDPGVADGQTVSFAGRGGAGWTEGPPGDLDLTVRVVPDPEFRRKGNDLECDLPVALDTAVHGGRIHLKTMRGTVTVYVPKGTRNGRKLRLRGLGMPVFLRTNDSGNLVVKVRVVLPEHLNEYDGGGQAQRSTRLK